MTHAFHSRIVRMASLLALATLSACASETPGDQCKNRNSVMFVDAPAIIIVYFASGQSKIDPKQMIEIEKRVREFQELGATEFHLSAHADRVGSADDNMRLSQTRLREVIRYIASLDSGIRIADAEAYGDTQVLVPTPRAEPNNRRVEIRASGHKAFTTTVDKCGNRIVMHRP